MTNLIDHTQLALNDLAEAGLGNESPAEAYVTGWRAGWDKALAYAIHIETMLNQQAPTEGAADEQAE
ncbi:hypothetical protein [Bifidobacterium miconisargentati]|uniref:hypothetical protein n=1 Tax=Bifidobacterium miconisargentati TaxID=2834437 RepID=UPI001BDD1C6F|nr:hypothetical protein [Bifidobacterium miconisargentati]MBW3090415.1 hypothetical protein [Bifidobacterium miconisargentati]